MQKSHFHIWTFIKAFPLDFVLAWAPSIIADQSTGQNALPAVEKDMPYADGGDEQKLDLYLPKAKGFTTIVFIYGGGWHTGSRKSVSPIGEKFQSLGYGCALLS